MPGAERAEIYFIVAMMVLIVILCGVAVFAFFRTYNKEMREKAARDEAKRETANHEAEIEELKAES